MLLSQDENLGYWWSTGFGFKSLSSFIFEWCDFRKNGLTENFCHKKESWKPLKTTQFCWLAVTKPFEQNLIMRHQWKEDIHIFHLIPCDTKYLNCSDHTDRFYNHGPNRKWKNWEWYVHIVRGPCVPLALDRLGAGDNKKSLLQSSINPLDFFTPSIAFGSPPPSIGWIGSRRQ